MYLRLAADLDSRIAKLKARYKATGDMKFLYSIQGFEENATRPPEHGAAFAVPGEPRKHENMEVHGNEF